MAEILETLANVTKKQSVARIEIFCDASTDQDNWTVVTHFEDGLYDSNDKLIGPATFGTRRTQTTMKDASQAVKDVVANAQVAAYDLRTADIVKEEAAKTAPAEEAKP